MPDPMRIRAKLVGDKADVRVLMSHEMESGQRKDSAGAIIPAWFIQDVSVQLKGQSVLTAQWGPSVSKNPYVQFMLRGAAAGDAVKVTWTDNRGETRTDETTVTA